MATGRNRSVDSAVDSCSQHHGAGCQLAGKLSFVSDLRQDFRDRGLLTAVEQHDTPAIFDWLIDVLSYQGIANSVADAISARARQRALQRHRGCAGATSKLPQAARPLAVQRLRLSEEFADLH